MSKATDKSAPAKTPAPAPAKAAEAPAKKEAAPAKSSGKVQVIYDQAGAGDGKNAIKRLEAAGFEVTFRKVDEIYNYMKHEDKIYVPANLAADAGKALGILRKVRSQLEDLPTSDDDTIFAWFIR